MLQLIGKKIITILGSNFLLIWTNGSLKNDIKFWKSAPIKGSSAAGFTLCMMSEKFFMIFCLLLFSKWMFSKISFRNIFRVSNCLNRDQDQHFGRPDLG